MLNISTGRGGALRRSDRRHSAALLDNDKTLDMARQAKNRGAVGPWLPSLWGMKSRSVGSVSYTELKKIDEEVQELAVPRVEVSFAEVACRVPI